MSLRPDFEFFNSGHWCAGYKGSPPDDVDFIIDVIEDTNALDSNGSETLYIWEDDSRLLHVLFAVYGREYDAGLAYDLMYHFVGEVQTNTWPDTGEEWNSLNILKADRMTESVDEVMEKIQAGGYPAHIDY